MPDYEGKSRTLVDLDLRDLEAGGFVKRTQFKPYRWRST